MNGMEAPIRDEASYLAHLEALWRRHWPAHLPKEPHYPFGEVPLTDYLRERAKRTPEKPCIIFYGEEVTFRRLDEWSDRLASYLLDAGLTKGDRVAVFLPNCPQFLIAFYGILKAGCVHVPVNPMYKAPELLHVLREVEARALIALDRLWPVVEEAVREISVPLVLTTSLSDFLPERPAFAVHPDIKEPKRVVPGTVDFMEVVLKTEDARHHLGSRSEVAVSLDDLAALNFTGGTTGIPKGCMHTQRNMLYTAAGAMTYTYQLGEGDVRLTYMPVFWIAGENSGVIYPVFSGVPHILLYRWDPVAVMQAVERYRVSCLGGVMDNIVELMEHPERHRYDLSSIRTLTVSSFVKKVTPEYRRKWRQISDAVIRETSYGMTETHTSDTFTTGFQEDDMDLKRPPTFCGLPMPGTQFKVVDFDTGELLPLGVEGEIVIRTPSLMKGYWKNPEETARVIRDGWFHTGDIGLIDESGFLIYRGRKKEMLKVKGMSVFPGEIEAMISKHPAVEGCAVVGKPDPDKGEVPVAFLTLKPAYQGQVNEQSLADWCRKQMASYKVPEIRIVEGLPLTATGKVRKEELKKCFAQSSA